MRAGKQNSTGLQVITLFVLIVLLIILLSNI